MTAALSSVRRAFDTTYTPQTCSGPSLLQGVCVVERWSGRITSPPPSRKSSTDDAGVLVSLTATASGNVLAELAAASASPRSTTPSSPAPPPVLTFDYR